MNINEWIRLIRMNKYRQKWIWMNTCKNEYEWIPVRWIWVNGYEWLPVKMNMNEWIPVRMNMNEYL